MPLIPIKARDFELVPWQQEAVERWTHGDTQGPCRGTLEVFTGGGKTLIALACVERAAQEAPDVRLAVVVPTEALVHQWVGMLKRYTNLQSGEVGILGAGRHDSLQDRRALVTVINTAARELPRLARRAQPLMLVVDECHRAGAPSFSCVLDTPARFRLGLSATPDREEVDEEGEPIEYDEHRLGQKLGEVVFRFGLADARAAGWLPEYVIHHHGISLEPDERSAYEAATRKIDDLADRLMEFGIDRTHARRLAGRKDDVGSLARAYVAATSQRKDLLYRARERHRIALRLVTGALDRREEPHILLFHERVREAEELFAELRERSAPGRVVLEHSRLPDKRRAQALNAFRAGEAQVLVSVKSLIEGIDVPGADVGVSVAATSSVRQRIQALGRVLRKDRERQDPKTAEMHLLYVADSVDEFIYAKEDWSDVTGANANRYWLWPLDTEEGPEPLPGPPHEPRPTEEQEWERLGGRVPPAPVEWQGTLPDREYSVDTRGTVTNQRGSIITNSQLVGEMVEAVRGRPGGRFYVTPVHRLVLVRRRGAENGAVFVAGALREPFSLLRPKVGKDWDQKPADLTPGKQYRQSLDKEHGSYWLRQRRGGVIERRKGARTREFAVVEGARNPELAENARRVLEAWRDIDNRGFPFFVNKAWHAWYLEEGEPRFLAVVPGGFEWPDARGGAE